MKKRVAITGVGIISSLGDSPAALDSALCDGNSGLHPLEGAEFEGFHCRMGGNIVSFEADSYLQGKPLRPLDRTAQMVVSAAKLALSSSGWAAETIANHDLGLVLGTMFGSVHTISKFDRHALAEGPSYASPLDFANTVINAAAGQTAIWHGLRGINSTIACGAISGLMALGYAADLIRYGGQTAVLAGGVDEFCFESFCGFERAGLLANAGDPLKPSVPFDAQRNGFVLTEGAALLMLEEWDSARARGVPIRAELRGHGNAYDPSATQSGRQDAIVRAMRTAIEDSGVSPSQVDCISAAANGGVCSDRSEAFAIESVFNGKARQTPVTAIKSMLGEALGASGPLQVVSLLETMNNGALPGIAGLQQAGADLPALNLSARQQKVNVGCGIVNSVGFDGNACTVLVSRPER